VKPAMQFHERCAGGDPIFLFAKLSRSTRGKHSNLCDDKNFIPSSSLFLLLLLLLVAQEMSPPNNKK